ncbi:helix-turn-helix transcriptional regulator [Polluticoccus soli]|uniref:helix-turn-helix transcriptional regulator n=1 Tax=Polluticoccus soli TaxID=3034150 RepID=UPI0023E27498|nr:WYL domain-containing protein [Flavipsychrobacter sp. JY13-12]
MPVNRNALIRYKTIDKCLRNRLRKWTLEKLIEEVSDALYEYEGIAKGISRRTIQADIQMMRSDKLGYNAPIIIIDKKYYTYDDPNYSITQIPISEQDLGRMNEAIEVLKQFKGFSHFANLGEVVNKLEDHAYATSNNIQPVIDFEKNEQLRGLEYLDVLYNAVINKKPLRITYQSFTAHQASGFPFHIWWLKEFKNRWFAVGTKNEKRNYPLTLALDRILSVQPEEGVEYVDSNGLTPDVYYKDIIGVTVSPNMRTKEVLIQVNRDNAPYVETKPLHQSQTVIEQNEDGIVIRLKVQLNYELEKEILGFGEGMTVLAPDALKGRLYHRMKTAVEKYKTEVEATRIKELKGLSLTRDV